MGDKLSEIISSLRSLCDQLESWAGENDQEEAAEEKVYPDVHSKAGVEPAKTQDKGKMSIALAALKKGMSK